MNSSDFGMVSMEEKTLYTHVHYTPVGEPYLSIKPTNSCEQNPFQVITTIRVSKRGPERCVPLYSGSSTIVLQLVHMLM